MIRRPSSVWRKAFSWRGALTIGCALAFGNAEPARAATLPFTATLSVTVGALPGASFTATGVAVTNGPGGSLTLPASLFAGSAVFTIGLFTGVPQISGLKVTVSGNQTGSFNPSFSPPNAYTAYVSLAGGGVGGPLQLYGAVGVNILQLFSIPIPISGVGMGTPVQVVQGGIVITVVPTQWTTGMGYVKSVTLTTVSPHLPSSTTLPGTWSFIGTTTITGSDARTPGGAGNVTLVSPVRVATNVAGVVPVLATLAINFIPEPATGLLLLAGVAGLAALGRQRQR